MPRMLPREGRAPPPGSHYSPTSPKTAGGGCRVERSCRDDRHRTGARTSPSPPAPLPRCAGDKGRIRSRFGWRGRMGWRAPAEPRPRRRSSCRCSRVMDGAGTRGAERTSAVRVRDARPQGRDTGAPCRRRRKGTESGRAGGSPPLGTVVSCPTERAARPGAQRRDTPKTREQGTVNSLRDSSRNASGR